MVEMLFTLALAATVVGAATMLYAAAAGGAMDAAALAETGSGAEALAQEVNLYISNALDAEVVTVSGRGVLKLTMPAVRDPRDGRGMVTGYSPSYLHPRSGACYERGETVWIYTGGPPTGTGLPPITTTGTVPYLARRNDALQPTAANIDRGWTFLDGGNKIRRTPGAFSLTFGATAGDPRVIWAVRTIAGSGSDPGVYDPGRADSFRDLAVVGTTILREPGPRYMGEGH